MSQVDINQWLEPVAAVVGQPLSLDESGLLGLQLQSGLQCVIEFDREQEMLTFHGDLLSVQSSQTPALCRHAMEKNLYGIGSCGITLGLDSARSALVASVCYPASTLNEDAFVIHLERFISGFEQLHHDFKALNLGALQDGGRA